MAAFSQPELEYTVVGSDSANTPSQAFAAWATELGLTPTGTDYAWPTSFDDGCISIDSKATRVAAFDPTCILSTEGGFGVWPFRNPGNTLVNFAYPGVSRGFVMGPSVSSYPLDNRPALYFVARPVEQDLWIRTFQIRADNAGNFVVFYTLALSGSATVLLHVALRVEGFKKVTAVTLPFAGATAPTSKVFNLYTQIAFSESLTIGVSRQVVVENTGWAIQNGIRPPPTMEVPGVFPQNVVAGLLPPAVYGRTVLHYPKRTEMTNLPPPSVYGAVIYPHVRARLRRNHLYPGYGYIMGDIKIKGSMENVPTFSKIRLVRERDGQQVRQVWSDPVTGAWRFDDIEEDHTYTILAYDTDNNFRAVLASHVVPIHVEPLTP